MIIMFQSCSGVPRSPAPDTTTFLYLLKFLDECQEIREPLKNKRYFRKFLKLKCKWRYYIAFQV